jgi:hypothetical protein
LAESEALNGKLVKIPSPMGAVGFTELVVAGPVSVSLWASDQDADEKIKTATIGK